MVGKDQPDIRVGKIELCTKNSECPCDSPCERLGLMKEELGKYYPLKRFEGRPKTAAPDGVCG